MLNFLFRILSTNFVVDRDCSVSYTFKPLNESVRVSLIIHISDGEKNEKLQLIYNNLEGYPVEEICSSVCAICDTPRFLQIGNPSSKIITGSDKESWIKRYFTYCLSKGLVLFCTVRFL